MPGPEHIVVATNFSPAADAAARRAAILAQGHESPLRVIHVKAPAGAADAVSGEPPDPRLAQLVRQLHGSVGIAVESAVLSGPLEATLASIAASEPVDLIVIGRDSAAPLWRMFRGATTMRCLRALATPLLITRDQDVPAYERWLVPVDFSATSLAALQLGRTWFPRAEIHVLHALFPELEAAPMEMPWSATTGAELEVDPVAVARMRVATWLQQAGHALPPQRIHVATGPVPRVTAEVAEKVDAQLIVAASDCDKRLGSIAAGLAAEGERDILLLNCGRQRRGA